MIDTYRFGIIPAAVSAAVSAAVLAAKSIQVYTGIEGIKGIEEKSKEKVSTKKKEKKRSNLRWGLNIAEGRSVVILIKKRSSLSIRNHSIAVPFWDTTPENVASRS